MLQHSLNRAYANSHQHFYSPDFVLPPNPLSYLHPTENYSAGVYTNTTEYTLKYIMIHIWSNVHNNEAVSRVPVPCRVRVRVPVAYKMAHC